MATTGNDTNPGTRDQPFATLQRAQQAARKAAGVETVTVLLRAGIYYLPETLVFTAEDSGTKAAPVVYQAYAKEQAVISGGVLLKDLKWEPYKDGIMQATVPAGFATDQLFVNGAAPAHGALSELRPQGAPLQRLGQGCLQPGTGGALERPGRRLHPCPARRRVGRHALCHYRQGPGQQDHLRRRLAEQPPDGHARQFRFVENIFEELDAPGEWFLDAKTTPSTIYPPGRR